jgi:hypothetical protein
MASSGSCRGLIHQTSILLCELIVIACRERGDLHLLSGIMLE